MTIKEAIENRILESLTIDDINDISLEYDLKQINGTLTQEEVDYIVRLEDHMLRVITNKNNSPGLEIIQIPMREIECPAIKDRIEINLVEIASNSNIKTKRLFKTQSILNRLKNQNNKNNK